MLDKRLNSSWLALRLAFGLVPIAAGLDKFFNLLTDWEQYLSPLAARLLPFSGATFMRVAGVIEIAVGIAILTKWTRPFAYVASAWLVLIALNLVSTGKYFDVAARDLVMAVGAFALGQLEAVRVAATEKAARASYAPSAAASASATHAGQRA